MKNQTADKILKLLKEGKYQKQIAVELKITKGAVSQHVKKLIKEGLIEEDIKDAIKTYKEPKPSILNSTNTEQDSTLTHHTINEPSQSSIATPAASQEAYRNHATYIAYPLEGYNREALAEFCKQNSIPFKEWEINNNKPLFTTMEDYGIRIYSRVIIIVPPDSEQPQSETLPFAITQEVLHKAWEVARRIEQALQLKIKQIGGFYVGALVRQELAQTNNPLAKNILEKKANGEIIVKEKTFRIIDPDTNRKCFEFDDSPSADWLKRLKEAEATDPANADNHATTVHIMLDDVLHKNAWAHIEASLQHTDDAFKQIAEQQKAELQWFRHHDEQIQASTKQAEANTKLINELLAERQKAQEAKANSGWNKLKRMFKRA